MNQSNNLIQIPLPSCGPTDNPKQISAKKKKTNTVLYPHEETEFMMWKIKQCVENVLDH